MTTRDNLRMSWACLVHTNKLCICSLKPSSQLKSAVLCEKKEVIQPSVITEWHNNHFCMTFVCVSDWTIRVITCQTKRLLCRQPHISYQPKEYTRNDSFHWKIYSKYIWYVAQRMIPNSCSFSCSVSNTKAKFWKGKKKEKRKHFFNSICRIIISFNYYCQ